MHEIQVGDKVRLTGADWKFYDEEGVSVGDIVAITEVGVDGIWAGPAGTVGNRNGLYSEDNQEHSGDYSVELCSESEEEQMTEFKVGDRVRFPVDGDQGYVTKISDGHIWVEFDEDGLNAMMSSDLELVKPFTEMVSDFSSAVDHKAIEEIGRLGDALGIEEPEPLYAPWEKELLWTPFEQNVRRITDQIADLLIAKNKAYGDSALDPIRVFSKSDRIEQLNVRIDDKISRIQRGTDFEDEDTVRDLAGYLVLRLIAEESE